MQVCQQRLRANQAQWTVSSTLSVCISFGNPGSLVWPAIQFTCSRHDLLPEVLPPHPWKYLHLAKTRVVGIHHSLPPTDEGTECWDVPGWVCPHLMGSWAKFLLAAEQRGDDCVHPRLFLPWCLKRFSDKKTVSFPV